MFNLPTRLRVGPYFYDCSYIPMDDEGRSNTTEQCIRINDKFRGDRAAGITMHELVHIWLDNYGIDLTEKQNEDVCLAVELGSVCFAKDEQEFHIHMVEEMGKL